MTKFKSKNYKIYSEVPKQLAEEIAEKYINRNLPIEEVLQDDKGSFVAKFKLDDNPSYVLKIPKQRNKRPEERFRSIFRTSYSVRIFKQHPLLQKLGFNCPDAIVAGELRKCRVVVDSFFVYKFQEGNQPQRTDAKRVIDTLAKLHELGYTRGDPKIENFLINEGRVYFIDFQLRKYRVFKTMRGMDEFVRHQAYMQESKNYLRKKYKGSISYKLAVTRREFPKRINNFIKKLW